MIGPDNPICNNPLDPQVQQLAELMNPAFHKNHYMEHEYSVLVFLLFFEILFFHEKKLLNF